VSYISRPGRPPPGFKPVWGCAAAAGRRIRDRRRLPGSHRASRIGRDWIDVQLVDGDGVL